MAPLGNGPLAQRVAVLHRIALEVGKPGVAQDEVNKPLCVRFHVRIGSQQGTAWRTRPGEIPAMTQVSWRGGTLAIKNQPHYWPGQYYLTFLRISSRLYLF